MCLFAVDTVAISPKIRRRQARKGLQSGMYSAADHLIDVLQRCLKGEGEAVDQAQSLIKGQTALPTPSREVAAWDLFYRVLEATSADLVLDLVRATHARDFATPPLVKAVVKRFPIASDSPLKGAHILACRHLMASTVAELDSIHTMLPDAEFVKIIGKPYSTNRLALIELSRKEYVRGDTLDTADGDDDEFGSYAQRHQRATRNAVDAYIARHPDSSTPLLVIDDGGALIEAVGRKVVDGTIRCPVVAIEQTTHGFYALDRKFFDSSHSGGFAVIRAFESQAKIAYEAPLIAKSVVQETWTWLDALRQHNGLGVDMPERPVFGVIGFGVVGGTVVRELAQAGYVVAVYDKSRQKIGMVGLSNLSNIEMAWSLSDLCKYADVIIGASGGTSIGPDAASALTNGTILVSASSGDREFRGLCRDWKIESLPIIVDDTRLTPYERAHGLLRAHHGESNVYVVNHGYPVNFDGSLDPIPVSDIQLTRALMVGAVIQAAGSAELHEPAPIGHHGDVGISEAVDSFLIDEFRRRGSAEHHDVS